MVCIDYARKNYLMKKYGTVEMENVKNEIKNEKRDDGDVDVTSFEMINRKPEIVKAENIVSNYSAENAAKPKSFELNGKYNIERAYAYNGGNESPYEIGESTGDVVEIKSHYSKPENCDDDCGCRTAPHAMTASAWKSRYAANDANRPRSKRSSIVKIDNRRCSPGGNSTIGHWGKIKSSYCKNVWD